MKRRLLTEEETALWRRALEEATPAGGRTKKAGAASAARKTAKSPERKHSRSAVSALGAGDPAMDRRLARRSSAIDRTIDLHGLTQAAAEPLLRDFIMRASKDGARRLLVITGKGARSDQTTSRGVLKRRFLDWIDAPPLRALIARVAEARPRHGGAGAFYVFLKQKRRECAV